MKGLRERARFEIARHYIEGVRHGVAESLRASEAALNKCGPTERKRIEEGVRASNAALEMILRDLDENRREHIAQYVAAYERGQA